MTTGEKAVAPFAIMLVTVAVLLVIRKICFRIFAEWAGKTEIYGLMTSSLRLPSVYLCIAVGLYAGVVSSDLPARHVLILNKAVHVIVILSLTGAAVGLNGRLFAHYVQRPDMPFPSTGLVHGIVSGMLLIIGLLLILSAVGISIAPLVTALGVSGLAVALALQDTLSNLFAGIHVLLEKPVRVGDFIRLETGQEGYIQDISWRTTRIRMLTGSMAIIPNTKLSQSVVVNYFLPGRSMAVPVSVSINNSFDPVLAERILQEETARAVHEVNGLLAEPAPSVQLIPGFGTNAFTFTITCFVREYEDQFPAQHELRLRIAARLQKEKIAMA